MVSSEIGTSKLRCYTNRCHTLIWDTFWSDIELPAGIHRLRFVADTGLYAIDRFEFTAEGS